MSASQVEAPVRITEAISRRLFRGELPNGKLITVFFSSDDSIIPLSAGDEVTAILSLADFSRGRIAGKR